MIDGIKTNAIVLKEITLREADKILICLSEDLGKISVSARGVKRPKNQNIAASQFLTYSQLVVYSSANMYSLSQSSVIESFYDIRKDVVKLTYASHFSQIIQDSVNENDDAKDIIKMLLNILYYVMKDKNDLRYLACVFEFRILKYLGYMPIFENVIEDKRVYMSFKSGRVSCEKSNDSIYLSCQDAQIMNMIFNDKLKNTLDNKIDKKSIESLKSISGRYLEHCLERKYVKLNYINLL